MTGSAQYWNFLRHELTLGIGTSNFLGELGGSNGVGASGINGFKDLEFEMTRPAISAGYRYYLNPNFALKTQLTYTRLNGDDALTEERFRKNRNLHFRSPLIEMAFQIEYYPLKEYFGHLYRTKGVMGKKVNYASPYILAGIDAFWFNPKARYDNTWVALAPLQTEGVAYRKIAAALHFGLGFKYAITNQLSIGAEMGLRYTNTDYIDDVSGLYIDKTASDDMTQYLANPTINSIPTYTDGDYTYDPTAPGMKRGNASNNDAYLLTVFNVNYKLLKGRKKLPKF